ELDGKIPCHKDPQLAADNAAVNTSKRPDVPWLRVVDVAVLLLVRVSRGVRSRLSSRSQHLRGLVQDIQTQAHTQAALQAQLEAQEGEMEKYLEEKKASQKRRAATFQPQDKKKAVYQAPQRSVTTSSAQVSSQRSPSVNKECPHCWKTHGGSECWMIAGKCLKCGSSDHKIKDCLRLQQGVQRGAPAPAAVAAAAPATGRPGRPRAPARVFALAREDAEQAEHVTKGTVLLLGVHARVLYHTGASHSFISERFARELALESAIESEELEVPLSMHTPAGTLWPKSKLASTWMDVHDESTSMSMDAKTKVDGHLCGRLFL
ncbi:hypothetical protein Taro_047424, partial [Colocasia esculenta]|nr:hypothetical protein [Colocasia esculenta]